MRILFLFVTLLLLVNCSSPQREVTTHYASEKVIRMFSPKVVKFSDFNNFIHRYIEYSINDKIGKLLVIDDFNQKKEIERNEIVKNAKKYKASLVLLLELKDTKKINIIEKGGDFDLERISKKGYYNYIIVYMGDGEDFINNNF